VYKQRIKIDTEEDPVFGTKHLLFLTFISKKILAVSGVYKEKSPNCSYNQCSELGVRETKVRDREI
jgi:hypothetical protein